MKKKLSETAVNHFKSNSVDVHITGPFHNSGQSHWVVVYGDNGEAYMLKAQFILLYFSCLLHDRQRVTKSNINIDHCKTYYEIGICKFQFGPENLWKHHQSSTQPVKRISFVYSCDTKEGDTAGKKNLVEVIKFFFVSIKKLEINPIGPLILEHLHDKAGGLYNRFMKDSSNEDLVAEKITNDIHQQFSGG